MIKKLSILIAAVVFTWLLVDYVKLKHAEDSSSAKVKPEEAPPSAVVSLLPILEKHETHWEPRVKAIQALPEEVTLSQKDLRSLYDYCAKQPPAGEGLEDNWYVVVNEVMEVIRERHLDPKHFGGEMVQIIENPQVDAVVRDYALQHLSLYLDPRRNGNQLPVEQQAKLVDRTLKVMEHPQNTEEYFVGTGLTALSLLPLKKLSEAKSQDDVASRLERLTMELASGLRKTVLANRISAIQTMAELQHPQTVKVCRSILNEAHTSLDFKLSAIAAIGLAGEAADIAFIQSKAQQHPQLKYASEVAVKRLNSKL